MAQKKDKMIEEYLNAPFKIGDIVLVPEKLVKIFKENSVTNIPVKIKKIEENKIFFDIDDYGTLKEVSVNISETEKYLRFIGANPFTHEDWRRRTRTLNYDIGGILTLLFPELSTFKNERFNEWKINGIPVKETNFNPYIIDKNGNKQYYQRPFVWTIEEKQLLIESIYKGLNCGQIIIRNHSQKEVDKEMKAGNTEICFRDIVDGKQRINTLYEFLTDKFPDLHGNYYSDLSERASQEFNNSQAFTFAEMDEGTTDDDVISTFLNVNFTGIPQSKEHIAYVENIAKLMK